MMGDMDLRRKQIIAAELSGCIAATGRITVGVRSDGAVLAAKHCHVFGHHADRTPDLIPFDLVDVSGYRDVVSISARDQTPYGISRDGVLRTPVVNYAQWRDVVQFATGNNAIALRSDGTVVAEGPKVRKPGSFPKTDDICVDDWKDIVAVAAGPGHVVGLKADGTVVACGDNRNQKCNVNGKRFSGIVAIAAGHDFTLGLKSDGTVVGAGYVRGIEDWRDIVAIAGAADAYGVKADGTVVATHSWSNNEQVSTWRDIVAVSAGFYNHVAGLRRDGTVVETVEYDDGEETVGGWKLFDDWEAEYERRVSAQWHARMDVRQGIEARRRRESEAAKRVLAEKLKALKEQRAALVEELAALERVKGLRGLLNGKQKDALKASIREMDGEIAKLKAEA